MFRILNTVLLCLLFFSASAYDDDSLFVTIKNREWVLPYSPANGEDLFTVARRFHVPPSVLGSINELDYKSKLPLNKQLIVPVAVYNFVREKPFDMVDAMPLYYKVRDNDDLQHLSRLSGVSQQVMMRWNNMHDNNIYIGNALFIGWVLYDATSGNKGIVTSYDSPAANNKANNNSRSNSVDNARRSADPESAWSNPRSGRTQVIDEPQEPRPWHDTVIIIKRPADSVKILPFEETYLSQTGNGIDAVIEKGSVAFFNNAAAKASTQYYAMHNGLERGTIVKVYNPGNDKMVYAKVIGPLPATKQYYNCIMALSGNAKEELGIRADKLWCEVSHR